MIPYKLWARLTDSLVAFRANPNERTDFDLFVDETICNFPFNANAEQIEEWQNICDRTRAEFEQKAGEWKRHCGVNAHLTNTFTVFRDAA